MKTTEPVECLILSVGTSYEPLVLNIKLLNPCRVLFLYTEKSERYLDKVVKYCNLNAARYDKSIVHETEPLDIYREIKRAFLKWNKPEKIFIDITSGTKAMSAVAAMAGAMIGVQLLYVGSTNYLADFKEDIPDPDIRQELNFAYLLAKGYEAWDALNFLAAYENIQSLNREIRRDRRIHKQFLLMDFAEHLEKQEEVLSKLIKIPEPKDT